MELLIKRKTADGIKELVTQAVNSTSQVLVGKDVLMHGPLSNEPNRRYRLWQISNYDDNTIRVVIDDSVLFETAYLFNKAATSINAFIVGVQALGPMVLINSLKSLGRELKDFMGTKEPSCPEDVRAEKIMAIKSKLVQFAGVSLSYPPNQQPENHDDMVAKEGVIFFDHEGEPHLVWASKTVIHNQTLTPINHVDFRELVVIKPPQGYVPVRSLVELKRSMLDSQGSETYAFKMVDELDSLPSPIDTLKAAVAAFDGIEYISNYITHTSSSRLRSFLVAVAEGRLSVLTGEKAFDQRGNYDAAKIKPGHEPIIYSDKVPTFAVTSTRRALQATEVNAAMSHYPEIWEFRTDGTWTQHRYSTVKAPVTKASDAELKDWVIALPPQATTAQPVQSTHPDLLQMIAQQKGVYVEYQVPLGERELIPQGVVRNSRFNDDGALYLATKTPSGQQSNAMLRVEDGVVVVSALSKDTADKVISKLDQVESAGWVGSSFEFDFAPKKVPDNIDVMLEKIELARGVFMNSPLPFGIRNRIENGFIYRVGDELYVPVKYVDSSEQEGSRLILQHDQPSFVAESISWMVVRDVADWAQPDGAVVVTKFDYR